MNFLFASKHKVIYLYLFEPAVELEGYRATLPIRSRKIQQLHAPRGTRFRM